MNNVFNMMNKHRLRQTYLNFTQQPDEGRCRQLIASAGEWLSRAYRENSQLIQYDQLRRQYGDNQEVLLPYLSKIDSDAAMSLCAYVLYVELWPLWSTSFIESSETCLLMIDHVSEEFFNDVENDTGKYRIKAMNALKVLWSCFNKLKRSDHETQILHQVHDKMSAVIMLVQTDISGLAVSTDNDESNRLRGQCFTALSTMTCMAMNWVIDGARFYDQQAEAHGSGGGRSRSKASMIGDLIQFNCQLDSINQCLQRMNKPKIASRSIDALNDYAIQLPLKNEQQELHTYRHLMAKIEGFEQLINAKLSPSKQRAMRPVVDAMRLHVHAKTKGSALLYDDQRDRNESLSSLSRPPAALLVLSFDALIQEGVNRLETHRYPIYEQVKQALLMIGHGFSLCFCVHQRSALLSSPSLFQLQKKPHSAALVADLLSLGVMRC